ncbi:MAG TPA: hypothetical protein VFZ24_09760 [Longimicrobiales bacterium]
MEPVPYQIREEDVDEVLSAHESVGGSWTREQRSAAREVVMRHVLDIDEAVRTAPEDRRVIPRHDRAEPEAGTPGEDSPARREMALAAIEDLLIREGFLDVADEDERVFPIAGRGR